MLAHTPPNLSATSEDASIDLEKTFAGTPVDGGRGVLGPADAVPKVNKVEDDEAKKAQLRRIVFKQDLRIMPLSIWIYLLCALDRANIGNAKVMDAGTGDSMMQTLRLSDLQYKVALMVFYVAYMVFEVPSNLLLKRFSASRWIAILCGGWGVMTMCLGAVNSYASLTVVRFLLGMFEAGLFPGLVSCLNFHYRPEDLSLRVALILASATLAGAFGGAIATGISYMNGVSGLQAWRWVFLLEGLPSVLTAPVVWFCFPDWPESCNFLTTDEKILGVSAPFSSISLFAPTIVSGLGKKGIEANLFTVPPYAVAWVVTVSLAFLADRTNKRGIAASVCALIASACYAALGALPNNDSRYSTRYGLLCIAVAFAFAPVPPLLGWLSTNARGTTETILQIPINVSMGTIGQMVGVWIYKPVDAPSYPTGMFVNFGFLLMTFITGGLLVGCYAVWNRRIARQGGRMWAT